MQALYNLRDWIPSIPIPVTEPKWPRFLALNWMTLGVYGPVKNALAFWRWDRLSHSGPCAFVTRLLVFRVDLALAHTDLIWNKGDRAWREGNHREACEVLRSVKAQFMQYAEKYDLSFLQRKREAVLLHPDRVPEPNKADAALFFRVVTDAYVNFLRRKIVSSAF